MSGYIIDLAGRRSLVTGAGQHTGRHCVGLAQAGAEVFVNDVVADRAEAVCDEVRAAGGAAQSTGVRHHRSRCHERRHRCSAARHRRQQRGRGRRHSLSVDAFGASDPTSWKKLIDLNLYGVLNTTFAALPHMTQQKWGRIVTIISDAGAAASEVRRCTARPRQPAPGSCRGIAAEYGFDGVTANAIAFGAIQYEHRAHPRRRR